MFGFCHFAKIQIDSGFSHTCVLLSNHFKVVLLSGEFHTDMFFLPNMCVFYVRELHSIHSVQLLSKNRYRSNIKQLISRQIHDRGNTINKTWPQILISWHQFKSWHQILISWHQFKSWHQKLIRWHQKLIRWHQKLIRWHQFKLGTKN